MVSRGWLVLVVLARSVFSVPVSTTHMDSEDVQVMKCIVEVLADVLSKPHSIPVSQQCLQTLRTDDRLVTVLRHRNFLQELQDIAVEGANEKPEKRMKDSTDFISKHSEDPKANAADRSMLVAAERPAEEKRGKEEKQDKEHEKREKKMQEHNGISSQEKRNEAEEYLDEEPELKRAVMKKVSNEVEEEKKRSSSEEEEEEDEAVGAGEHSEAKKSAEEEEEEESQQETEEKRRESPGQLEEEEEEKAKAGVKHWSRTRQLAHRRAEMSAYDHQEAPHHSKEVAGQGEGEVWKSPEEQELQMMARSDPEERREEEGSASKKTEDPEIESLAAIESELENVAQKLHELRRG